MTRMLTLVLGLLVTMDVPAAAQFDHLHCYKVRADHAVRGTVDVGACSRCPRKPGAA